VTELRSTVIDPLSSEVELDKGLLPPLLVDWIRAQTDSFNYQYVIRARPGVQEGETPSVIPAAQLPEMDEVNGAVQALRDFDDVRHEVAELRRRILTLRDHAVGAEAELGQARREHKRMEGELEDIRDDIEDARQDVAAIRLSASWRVGQAVVAPLSGVRRKLRGPA
jgi:hypothetical protein